MKQPAEITKSVFVWVTKYALIKISSLKFSVRDFTTSETDE